MGTQVTGLYSLKVPLTDCLQPGWSESHVGNFLQVLTTVLDMLHVDTLVAIGVKDNEYLYMSFLSPSDRDAVRKIIDDPDYLANRLIQKALDRKGRSPGDIHTESPF